jgi:uncharacterized protein with PQ loop repeat
MLIYFGHTGQTDIPRTSAALFLSLFIGLNILAILGFLAIITGKVIIINSKAYTIVAMAVVIALNFLLLFYKRRYKKIEVYLSTSWNKEKYKSILTTVSYIIFTAVFLWLSIKYIKIASQQK